MIACYSKRNQVYPVLYHDCAAVEKHFSSPDDWARERTIYTALSGKLPVPALLAERPGLIITEYCTHKTLLAVLEEQERTAFAPQPWEQLARWLLKCHTICGILPADGNLRNFLWNAGDEQILGLDFESYETQTVSRCGAAIIASLTTYDPAGTEVKARAAGLFAEMLQVPPAAIHSACEQLHERRSNIKKSEMSGVILAGGLSRRMGANKAELPLLGKSLLLRQVEKMRSLGIGDIMISGSCRLPGTRTIPDEYPDRGPLGGLHACLKAAANPACLVLGVDVPLVPANALSHLCRAHRGGATVLTHGDKQEPLIAVYDSALHLGAAPLIEQRGAPVRALWEMAGTTFFEYLGPEGLLSNCNTPEDLARMEALATAYRAKNLPL